MAVSRLRAPEGGLQQVVDESHTIKSFVAASENLMAG